MIIKQPKQKINWGLFLRKILEQSKEIDDGVGLISDIPDQFLRTHKFDQYIPEELIRKRAATEWIDWRRTLILLKENVRELTEL
jgi:hypothetical protein